MARTRTHSSGKFPVGGFVSYTSTDGIGNYTTPQTVTRDMSLDVCVDELGKDKSHPLTITKVKRVIEPLNGTRTSGPNTWLVRNFYANNATLLADTNHVAMSFPTVAQATTKLLARTNPNRVESSIPQFIGELKDVPSMFKWRAQELHSKRPKFGSTAGGAYLQWKFGWEPLIRDLSNFLNSQSLVDKRVAELVQLYKNGGIRRRLNLAQTNGYDTGVYTILSFPPSYLIDARISRVGRGSMWGTIRWVPTAIPKDMSNKNLQQLARNAVFGIGGVHLSDVWELLPWSWMVDWCSNVGDWLQSRRNKIPVAARDICIMKYRETKGSWSRTDSQTWVGGGGGTVLLETKERFLGVDSLSASIPFLNGGQLSILGALVATRR